MDNLMNWFRKKKKETSLHDCTSFEVEKTLSDSFFGGFKEYKPPIYEHESILSVKIKTTDLLGDHTVMNSNQD